MAGENRKGPLRAGESVILIDGKGEEKRIVLTPGKGHGTHRGNIPHDAIIGLPDGSVVSPSMGAEAVERAVAKRGGGPLGDVEYRVFRPTYIQYVMNQKRRAQIIYPKDTGPILLWADIFPGATVVESGIGWGALSIKLVEAVGPEGRVISYEIRDDFAEAAKKTVEGFLGECPNHEIKVRNVYEGIDETDVDRIVLDLPEPWQVVPHALKALAPGGLILSYLPSTIQVKQLCDTFEELGGFAEPEVFEVIHRPWHVKGLSVRPVQWMFSHSAFLTVARRTG